MQSNWDEPNNGIDILADIAAARDFVMEMQPYDPWENMIFTPRQAEFIQAIMKDQGFTHLSQVYGYLAGKIIREEGLDRYCELLASAFLGIIPGSMEARHEAQKA